MNSVLRARSRLRQAVRDFFGARNYLEVDTPILVTCPGTEVYLNYFKTAWEDFRHHPHPVYLRSSPELHMKQVLATGEDRIFQIGPCFRNRGELSDWHRPEFTMIEWYEAGIPFDDYIHQTCDLLACGYEATGRSCSFPENWQIMTVSEAFQEYVGVELEDGDPDLGAKVESIHSCSVSATDSFETAFFKSLLELVEPAFTRLGGVVLKDYPKSQAALSQIREGVAKRFEVYWNGVELCNGFEEALDASDNQSRYASAMEARRE